MPAVQKLCAAAAHKPPVNDWPATLRTVTRQSGDPNAERERADKPEGKEDRINFTNHRNVNSGAREGWHPDQEQHHRDKPDPTPRPRTAIQKLVFADFIHPRALRRRTSN
jgi:hypothetical protein